MHFCMLHVCAAACKTKDKMEYVHPVQFSCLCHLVAEVRFWFTGSLMHHLGAVWKRRKRACISERTMSTLPLTRSLQAYGQWLFSPLCVHMLSAIYYECSHYEGL